MDVKTSVSKLAHVIKVCGRILLEMSLLAVLQASGALTADGVAVRARGLANDVCWSVMNTRLGVRELELNTDVELRQCGGGKGMGVFAKRALPEGVLVRRYTGTLRRIEEHRKLVEDGVTSSSYAFSLGSGFVIDAEDEKDSGWARFVNHSVRRQSCQCVPVGLPSATEPFAIYFETTRKIAAGEELLIDYGKQYWDTQLGASSWYTPRRLFRRTAIDFL